MEWLRRLEEGAKTPIFIVTGGDPEKYIARARELGALAFFRKPVVHDQSIAALRRVLAEESAVF
jgi:DNA-binding response OmpR family regulator